MGPTDGLIVVAKKTGSRNPVVQHSAINFVCSITVAFTPYNIGCLTPYTASEVSTDVNI
jgi:hypothetical protein